MLSPWLRPMPTLCHYFSSLLSFYMSVDLSDVVCEMCGVTLAVSEELHPLLDVDIKINHSCRHPHSEAFLFHTIQLY